GRSPGGRGTGVGSRPRSPPPAAAGLGEAGYSSRLRERGLRSRPSTRAARAAAGGGGLGRGGVLLQLAVEGLAIEAQTLRRPGLVAPFCLQHPLDVLALELVEGQPLGHGVAPAIGVLSLAH